MHASCARGVPSVQVWEGLFAREHFCSIVYLQAGKGNACELFLMRSGNATYVKHYYCMIMKAYLPEPIFCKFPRSHVSSLNHLVDRRTNAFVDNPAA